MSSDFYSRDEVVDRGSVPLDIDDVHMLLQVEQEQIQKKTFTNWVNAQLAKRRPPCMILDLFQDFRDGSRLLDLLEVMSGQRLSRERGRGMFQHRSNIEKALSFLKAKSIKLVNINIPDIIDGKPSIILGLIWTIILQYHIEELASSLSFSSRQSSMESLASLDSRSTLSSRSASSSPAPPRGSPLHRRFRVSAKKALLLWVREQCHRAGCTLNVKDFKTSWRSGVVFLAILYALRPDVVDLSKARTRSNRQNLEEAFRVAESELRIPKLLDPDDVDVRDPDEKSIMTYVAQFLQYSKDLPVAEEDVQASPDQKVKEVTCWLLQALDELLEGWDSTEGESYAERYHVFHTFVVSFSEQRRSIIPLLTATRRSPNPSREQRALREAWDALAEKLRDYRIQLDTSLPAPLDAVARWLLKTEGALGEEETEPQDHGRAADDAKEKQELLKVCLEEMPQHLKTFQSFQNTDHDGNMMVPSDKLDELKRRFTSVRVSAKYHGIKLEYRELRHTALDLLGQIRNKLQVWKRPYITPEAVRVLLQEWHECVNTRQLPSMLESTLHKLKQVSEKYSSKSALAADYPHVSQQVKQLEEDGAAALAGVATAKSIMGRVLSAWESYADCLSSLQAWLEQNSVRLSHGHRAEVTAECLAEWESRRARLTEAGTFLMEFTDPQTSRILEEELRRFHLRWTEFTRTNSFAGMSSADTQVSAQDVQTLVRESTLILKEPLEAMTGPLHTYRKRLQLIIRKLQEVDFDALSPSSECPADHLQKLKLAVPEVLQTLLEAEQVCAELLHSVSGLDWRLAELHFWITEAREVYQHLKTTDRQRRGQDPRARVLISRGLQLEGQVVTEDQDLQVMVMTSQKNSPIQYLHASAMQERVRGAVAQSQEVVGMLSSLGARRDRSRSPSEGRPPTKVFIQDEKTQRQVDSGPGCLSPQVQFKSQCHDPFLPKIVVQEYSEEKMPSTLSVCAQSLMTNEGISGARDQSYPQTHQPSQEEEMEPQQQPLQQVQQPEPGAQKQQWQQEHQQPEQHPRKYPVQKQSEAKIQVQTQVQEEPEPSERASSQEQGAVKLPLTPQELQSRKAKAAKNRPWLQKPAERLGARPDSSQANVESIRAQPEPPVQGVPQQSEKELKKREQEQVQLVRSLSDPSTESTTAAFTQPPLKKKFPSQPQAKVGVQPAPQTAGQASPEVAYSPTGGQPPPKTVSQTQSQDPPQTRVQTHLPAEPQLSTPSQGLVPEPVIAHAQIWAQVRPSSPMQASLHGHVQPPVPAHVQLRSHPPSWAPVRPPSPKPPTHPQSHMQTTVQPGTMTQPMTQNAPLDPQPQGHPQPLTTVQYSDHFSQSQIPHWTQVGASTSVAVPQLHAKMQPLFYPQGYVQGQAPARPWVPQQEPHIQAVPQQRHPISQAYPQQMDQAPESRGHPTGTVPPQWPPLGPPLGPSGYSVELSYTQPRVQTEALPQVINRSSSTQAQMTTYDDLLRIQTHPGQVQQQTWVQTSSQPQDYSHTLPQMPLQPPTLPLAQQHIIAQSPLEVKPRQPSPETQLPAQTRPQMHSTGASPEKCKNSAQLPPQGELQSPVRSKPPPVTEPSFPTEPMGQSAFKAESSPPTQHVPPAPQVTSQPHPKDQAQGQVKDDLCDQAEVEAEVAPSPPEYPSPIQHQVQSPAQPKVMSPAQPGPPGPVSTSPEAQSPSQPRSEGQSQAKPPTPSPPRAQKSQTLALYQEDVLPPGPSESPDLCDSPLTLSQAPPQAYTEAYTKAQALARNGFEEAKHCLQEHILETISVFEDKSVSAEQASLKEETLRTLDPELLEEFLRAAKGMEAFCSPSQLRDMEFYTQCVRTQWEACISADSSFVEAGRHLQALKELCDTLSPEDAHRLAQTQLRECQTRLADIQRQFSGDQDVPLSDPRIPAIFSESLLTQREAPGSSDSPQISEASPVTTKTVPAERIAKQQASEEEVKKREGLERYDNCKRTLQAQLAKNELSITEVPPESVSLHGLHTRLQEIQFLRQETESLWAEYANQCSQLSGSCHMEQEKEGLQEEWSRQQSALQRRGSSLAAALRQIDSTQNHLVDFSDRLNRYLRQPKDIVGFTLVNSNILRDIKDLDDNIQSELGQLGRLDPDSSDLDPRDCFPLSSEVKAHRTSLDHLRQQVRKSEAAARALDRFLMSLRTLDEDVSGVHSAPSGDAQLLQDGRSKLAVMRQSVDSLKEKAPQLDLLLQGARLTVTRDGAPASCLDMVAVLLRRLDEADHGLASQQRTLQKENQSKSLGLRKRTLLAELRTLQDSIERQSLKEPTIPAVQHRLRALTELEGPLQTHQSELHDLRDLQEEQGGGENLYGELEAQWTETQKAFSDRKKQCNILLDLLKKFQSCRGHLSGTMQTAEQAVNEQASYMGKDYLQRSITKVSDIKDGLSGLGETIEEMRSVCRQLQSELKKSPGCSETSFEAEADALMDNWLDVTEKTDAYLDNLRVGLELWEKQLSVGGEVDSWAGAKLSLFAESHPFHNQQNVSDMKEEICRNEENIEHFHKKSVEIQEMLQSREAPLELQVMEGQLRKRMQQVKELFNDCADVFEELIAVKTHLAEKIEECHSAVENIQSSLNEVDGSESNVEDQIQNLCDELEAQEEQAEAVLKEVGMVSSVASPQVMEALSVDCRRLREAISHTKDLIHLKREERDKGLIQVLKDGRQSFEGWFQDLQLSVNECFENPESKTDVEVYLQRLAAFLKSKDADRRLDHLKDQLQRGGKQIPPEQQTEVTEWLREQRGEVSTFRSHCHNRQQQMESLLSDLSSLQKQHDSFRDWLQTKEKQSVELDNVGVLLKDLQEESGRAEDLGELLGSVRRQGVRAEGLLKDSDNLIQRYRNLSVRLEERAEAQNVLQGECDMFKSQAESTRTWITELLKPLSDPDHQPEEMIYKAQTVLSSKQEGDYKMDDLRRQGEHLCEQETLETVQKQKIQQSVGVVEEQWRNLLQTAEEVLNKAQTEADTQQQVDSFKSQIEDVQMWIRDQKKKLMSTSSHMPFDERIQIVKAVLSNRAKGESMVTALKSRCDALQLQESVRAELQRLVGDAEQQWRSALQTAGQAELRTLSEDFDAQSQNTQSWIREKQQQLQTVGAQTPPEERSIAAQTILISKPDGDCQVNNLRRRSQTLFDHTDADEGRKLHAQKLVRDAEETWRTVLMAAKHVEAAASAEITQRTEQKQLELSELDVHLEDVNNWLSDQKQQVDLLSSQTRSEDVMNSAQTIMSCKAEGDAKLQELKRRVQSASNLDIEEPKKQELQQQLRRAEEQWMSVVQTTKQNLDQAEKQRTLNVQLSDFRALSETTRTWLEDKQQSLETLASQADPETAINDTQAVLSCKPDGDSRLLELRRHSKSLLEQPDLEEHVKQQVHHTVQDSEEQWRRLLQSAEDNMKKAEVQYSLSRELEAFRNQAKSTSCWVKELQQEAESKGSGTQGSKAQIEDRLSTAQAVLSCRSSGEAQVTDLRRRAESLCGNSSLDGDRKLEVEQTARDAEERWRLLLEAAEDAHRQLTAVADLIQSCQTQRVQAERRLSEIKRQVSSVPRLFPWPGLGERRQAVEQAQMLLDRTAAMAPVLSDVRKQTAELFEITQDQSCTDPSWADKEESIPALLRELTDVVAELDQGILAERQCTQLVEQHEAAQDWLRDQVKSLTAPPEDREGLHSAVNTLKALLLTVDREQREMTELDLARDSLMNLCSPGGRDALALAVGHLHDLCDASEQELRERRTACEAALAELDQLSRRSQGLKERAAAIQWELRSLDQALGSSEAQNNVDSLQQRWNSLQNCQKSLGDLGVKVQDLHQEVQDFLGSEELPTDISTLVDALCQQHDSLKSRLRENQDTCCADSARCLTEHLHALQEWSRSRPARSTSSLQMSLEAGEKVQASLQEGLSHQQFLKETLTSALLENLEKNVSDALREAETHRTSLKESLKELEESSEDVAQDDAEQTPRKKSNEKTEEGKKVPSTEESASFKDDVSANLQNKDSHRLAPVTEDTLMKVDLSPEALPSEDTWKMMSSEVLPSEDTWKMMSSEALPSEDTLKMKVDLSSEGLPSEDTLKMKVDLSSEGLPSEDTLKMMSSEALPSEDTLMMKVDLSPEALPSEDTLKMMSSEALPSEDTLMMKVDLSSGLAEDQENSTSSMFSVEPIKAAVGEDSESLKPLGSQDEQQAAVSLMEKTESVETKLIPTRRKSKNSGPNESLQKLQSEENSERDGLRCSSPVTEPTGDNRPPPRKRSAVDLKLSSESASQEETESEREPGAQTSPLRALKTETVAEEAKETPATIQDVSDASTEVLKTVDPEIPKRKKSKSFEVSTVSESVAPLGGVTDSLCEAPAELENVHAQEESAGEQNKPLPPKRKSKSTDLPLKSVEHQTKEDPEVQRLTPSGTLVEETKLVPTRRRSKNGQVSIISETVQHLGPDNVESQPSKKEVNSQNSSNIGLAVTAALVEENKAKLSPTQRKSKGQKNPPEPASKGNGKAIKEAGRQQSLEKTEGKLTPLRRRSKASLPVTESESKDAGKESKSRSISSATQGSTLTSETTVLAESKLLTTARKSQSPKISPNPSQKDDAKASEKQGKVGQVSETPSGEETQVAPTRKSKESVKSQKSTEQNETVEKGKLSPVKRKPKGLKPSKEFPTRDVAKPDAQYQSSSPKTAPDKAKSTFLEKGKLSPTKRKSKAGKASRELSSTELPKTKEAPDEVIEPSNISESADEEMLKLSPTERESKELNVSSQSPDEWVQNPEESYIQALSSALDVDKTAAENTIEENSGISPDKDLTGGLKESSDLSEPEVTNTTEESDAEKKLSSPEDVTPDNTSPEVPDRGSMQTKEELDAEKPQSPVEVPTEVTDIKPRSEDWKPTSELSDQDIKARRDSDGEKSSSTAEEDESDGHDISSVGTEKEPTLEQETELVQKKVEGVASEMELKADNIYGVSQVTEAPEPPSEVSANELTGKIEARSAGVLRESTEISVLSVSKLLGETPETTDDGKGMSSSTQKQSPEAVIQVTQPEERSDRDTPGQVDTGEHVQLTEDTVTIEATGATQPKEGEEVPAPETSAPVQRNSDGTPAAPERVESLTQTASEGPPSEVEVSTNTVEEQNRIPSMENDLSRLSNEPANAPSLSEYIDTLWKDTDETEKRYMVLDLPEVSFSQTSDRAPDHQDTVVERLSEQDTKNLNETQLETDASAAEEETEKDTVEAQHGGSQEVLAQTSLLSEAAHPTEDMVASSGDVGTLKQILTQIPTKEEVKEETPDTLDTMDVWTKQIHLDPEVRVLHLDTAADLEERNTTETGERADVCIQREEAPEGEMIITADVALQEPSAEKPDVILKESSVDVPGGSAESITPSEFIEISIYETSPIETSREPLEGSQICPAPVQEQQVREEPEVQDENYVKMEKIEKGSEVHIFQQDTQIGVEEEIMSVKITKEPALDLNLSVQCGKDLVSDDVLPETDTVELTVLGVGAEEQDLQEQGPVQGGEQVSGIERTTADLLATGETTGEEAQQMKGPEQKQLISSQNLTYLEFEQEAHTEVKEEAVSDAKVSPRDVHDAADSLAGVEPKEESSISGVTTNEVQSEGTIVMGGASGSSALPVPADQKATDAKESDQDTNKNIPGPKMDTMEIEVVSLALPMVKTTSTLEEMASVASPQEVESSSEVICAELIWTEGTPSLQTHAEAGKDAVETDTQPTVFRSFREVQELWGTEPHSQLLQGMQQEDGPEALMTTSSDLENCRNRLVSKVLSCKNHPIRLEVTAMAQQLQEAQECRDAAQSRLTGLSEARAADADGSDDLDLMEDKWSAALQDAAAVIQQKEAELQLVTDYSQQSQSAKTTLESLKMQLGAAQMSPEESSSEQRERLSSLKKETEESRASLEQMVVAFDILAPHLSQSERMTAQNEIRDLQESWSSLERDIDRTLIQTELYSVETSNLLSSISNLHTNLEAICKDVEAKYPDAQWSCRKAKELLVANAEVKAAQQQHLQLQRLSEPLSLNSCWEKELTEVQQGLQKVRDQLAHTEGLVTSCMQRSGNPIMEKMMVVMKDGLSWAKQTECIIEGRRTKVALLPEEVHQQLRDLKKLQLEVIAKQGQLRTLVEEVTELLPELDQAEEVPVVNSTLELLQELSKLTTEKLTSAVGQVESGLQTREKLTEQIADLDSWVMAHLLREASKSADEDLSLAELDRRSGQTQENVVEAEKQLTVCEDLLMKINDISSELSITENSKLLKKLTNLKEDIQAIRNYERANKKDLNDHTQVIALSNESLNTVEKSLMQMLVDVGRHRYPITKDSLQALEPLKHMVLEHKSQIDLLQPWVPQERVKELYSVVSELLSKMAALERNSRDHETYLSMRQCVEDLRENIQEQVHQTKGDSMGQEERYKLCQTLILKIPLVKSLSEETLSKLQMISASLYPSQLNAEQQRLKLHQESLETLEVTLHNNLSIIEKDVLEDLDLDSEEKATLAFLQRTQKELQRTPVLEPDEAAVQKEYQKIMTLKVMIKSRMRVVEFLRTRKRPRLEGEFQNLKDLKDKVISECDSQMVNISQAREPLRSYTCAVKQAAQFLRDIELSLQPPQGPAGLCSERIEETQRAVHALQQHFQTHVEHLQDQVIVHPYLSPQKVQQLQETILSQLLVRMSTLQAKGHIQLEHLSRCAENNRKYTQCHEETLQGVKDIEENLLQVTRQKLASLADCVEQHDQLTTLGEEVEAQLRCLKDLKECCSEQSCYRRREATLAALWRRLSRLHHCTWKLATRSEDRITEWSEISDTVEKASVVLEQVEAELPDGAGVKASSEELQDLLQSWEQYQDRLDCEQRALSALELRTARLLGVPAHLEQAPPTPLCQKLQMMQARYSSVKKRSGEGLEVARMELEEREKVREELHGVQLWLEAADVLLNEMEQGRSTEELQEVHRQLCTQKALLQAMMDRMKRKYSDVQLLVPVELHGLLQEVQQSVQELEVKVVEAVDRSGPAYRLDAKLSEIQTGLRSVRQKLEQRSSTVAQAEDTQKRVWDELDTWHSCLAQLESDAQDLEKPEDTVTITDKLTEVQQLHSQLAKQAERRTALIGKVNPWLQEHQEMINSSDSWMSEAQSWLAAPCTYAGAKCLSGRVRALQRVLDDSAQIRTALQGFGSVLEEMSQVCDVTALREQLLTADRRVADVQERFTAPLSQLQHAVTKVESIEREVRQLEKDVAEIKKVLVSPESCPSLQKQRFKMVEQRVGSMRATVAQIQRCKPDLGLPGNAEETLTVFTVVNQLQSLLQDLEKKVPALFTQQPLNPAQSRVLTAEQTSSSSPVSESSHLEAERDQTEGRIGIAHLGEEVLKRSGAALLTVERPEPRSPDAPQEPEVGDAAEAQVGQTGEHAQGAEQLAEAAEAGASEASSEPSGPVRTQPESHSMVKTDSAEKLSKPTSGAQQRCVIS